jgi:hypothetical protein
MDIELNTGARQCIISVYDIRKKYCQQRAQRKRPETRRIWYNEGAKTFGICTAKFQLNNRTQSGITNKTHIFKKNI